MATEEPPPPRRGATAEERGPDVSSAQQAVEDARTWPQRLAASAHPRFWLSQAEEYPVGIKQFLWFGLLLTYPAWLFVLVIAWPIWVVGKLLEQVLYLLFWPVRRIWGDDAKERREA